MMYLALCLGLACLASAAACSEKPVEPQGVPPGAHSGLGDPAAAGPAAFNGTVVETMDASNYTYVRVDVGDQHIWAAAPRFEVQVGDRVSVPQGMPMENFRSGSLDRTFEVIYFVGAIGVEGAAAGVATPAVAEPQAEPHERTEASDDTEFDYSGVQRAEGGKTVAEVLDAGSELVGQEVVVRGVVVKYTPRIMGKNWIHLRDGTAGAAGANDLTVTTQDEASLGATVVVRGKVSADRDFGFGYKYDLMIEEASVTQE